MWGEAELPERLGELDLRISAEAFFQTNTEMAEVLYGIVVEYAALEGWERVYDLYCGIGTIALTLAPRAGRGVGDRARRAGRRRRDRGRAAQRDHERAASSPATPAWRCPSCSSAPAAPTCVVVDPPRAGLSKKVVHRIIDASPRRIVYVSCNPTTLAPNAAELVEAGWRLRARAAGRHVPADAPHRVRRAARAELSARTRPPGLSSADAGSGAHRGALMALAIVADRRSRPRPRRPKSRVFEAYNDLTPHVCKPAPLVADERSPPVLAPLGRQFACSRASTATAATRCCYSRAIPPKRAGGRATLAGDLLVKNFSAELAARSRPARGKPAVSRERRARARAAGRAAAGAGTRPALGCCGRERGTRLRAGDGHAASRSLSQACRRRPPGLDRLVAQLQGVHAAGNGVQRQGPERCTHARCSANAAP